ncbi:DUF6640 family protein [Curtobacterium sp. RRHDQ10]|uniref:DUF6640 family protein n=1 Tax=Curtobacterium phyllosphaerae TaxID=3413379 RepID=UPI003BEF74E9
MRQITVTRAVLTVTALYGGVGGFIADWNTTHIHNPNWPPHAKFHNAQTMSLGAGLALLTLAVVWGGRGRWSASRLALATALSSLYPATQLSALLYPGTALVDDPDDRRGPQGYIAAGLLVLVAVVSLVERRRRP